jgi:hypothetical protein
VFVCEKKWRAEGRGKKLLEGQKLLLESQKNAEWSKNGHESSQKIPFDAKTPAPIPNGVWGSK